MGFRARLAARQKAVNSLVCVGLDPLEEKTPAHIAPGRPLWLRVALHMISIVDATAPFASMYKPQKAHYEAIPDGQKALQMIVDYIHMKYPSIPVFLDCKRGDIDRTQAKYRFAHFEIDGVDGMNFSSYMGKDCMAQLVDKENFPGRAIVGLCYTSNKSAREVQDVILADGRAYWEFIAACTLTWAEELGITEDAGLVMAAAYEVKKGSGEIYSAHLSLCRKIVGNKFWYLMPGVGTQEGFIEETVSSAFIDAGSIAINSSSGITCVSMGEDYAEAAAHEAMNLRDTIRAAGGSC